MSNTDAMKKARIVYEQKVKQIVTAIDKQIYNQMLEYCEQKDMTKKAFIENAITYYIDNH